MLSKKARTHLLVTGAVLSLSLPAAVQAAAGVPTVEQALSLAPVQTGVDYAHPSAEDTSKCTIAVEKRGKTTSWVVRDPAGQVLRRFADTNADNLVDQWSYFQDGLEVYRDIDANFNGKADQYRWFNTGGSKWGMDSNEDGKIDQWKTISAEEVAGEVVAAFKTGDDQQFANLLLKPNELTALGVGPSQAKEMRAKIETATQRFRKLAAHQRQIGSSTKFIDFTGSRPGVVPSGTRSSTKDLLVYENASALIETSGKPKQVLLGTIVRLGETWRLIDVPSLPSGDTVASTGYFFQTSTANATNRQLASSGPSERAQKLMAELEKLDHEAVDASPTKQGKLNNRRVDLLEKLAAESKDPAEREQWVRQLADTVGVAVQSGTFPEGVARLKAVEAHLGKEKANQDLVAYVAFRRLSADYAKSLQAPNADFVKIQSDWVKQLEAFVQQHAKSPDTAEALLQLAIAEEFSGRDDDATRWYSQLIKDFPKSAPAQKAAGAKRRLESVGKRITLRGRDLRGRTVDLANYRGKIVLVQYWATWCEPCITDMARIKELLAKYTKRGFAVVGVSLDSQRSDVVHFLKTNRIPWQQVYEPGGLESRMANEMGILTLPTMLLVDEKGRVINRSIHVTELDSELKKLLR